MADAPEPSKKLPKLSLVARDQRYAVLVKDRIPRGDVQLVQVAMDRGLHEKLQTETFGSLAQVVPALLRYALEKLEADKQSLQVNLPPSQ